MRKNFQVVLEHGLFLLIDPETKQAVTDENLLNQITFRSWPGKPFIVQLEVDKTSSDSVKSIQDINITIDTQENKNGI